MIIMKNDSMKNNHYKNDGKLIVNYFHKNKKQKI